MNILTIEEMKERVDGIDPIVLKCRAIICVLQEFFNSIAARAGGGSGALEIEDELLWAEGMRDMCRQVGDNLINVHELTFQVGDDIKLYSLDEEKVEEQKKHLRSIGISNP